MSKIPHGADVDDTASDDAPADDGTAGDARAMTIPQHFLQKQPS